MIDRWPQPPYYVTQIVSQHYQPLAVRAKCENAALLDVSAKCSEDGRKLVLQVVNPGNQPLEARLNLAGFVPREPIATVEELSGDADAVNSATSPGRVCPITKQWPHGIASGSPRYVFPAMSFTLLEFQ